MSELDLRPNGLIDIYRIPYPNTVEYTFFSAAHETFSKIDYLLGYSANLNKYRKTEITPYIFFSDYSRIRLSQQQEKSQNIHKIVGFKEQTIEH